MSNKYTNKEAISLAQCAYFNFTNDEIKLYRKNHNLGENYYPTIRELLVERCGNGMDVANGDREGAYEAYYAYFDQSQANFDEVKQFIDGILGVKKDTEKEYSKIDEDTDGVVWDTRENITSERTINGTEYYVLGIADWRVCEVCENNYKSGLYALTLLSPSSSGEGEKAVVSFRGSEMTDNTGNPSVSLWDTHSKLGIISIDTLMKDWILADAGIAYGEGSIQEFEAAAYLQSILDKESISEVATVGHSLGGDLALVSAVLCASDNSKFTQAVSFDGPGQKQEFVERYASQIKALNDAGKLHHYYYTLVGAIFDSFAAEDCEIKTTTAGNGGFGWHSLYNIALNGENVIKVSPSQSTNTWAKRVNNITDFVDSFDFVDNLVEDGLVDPLTELAKVYLARKGDGIDEDFELTDESVRAIATVGYRFCDAGGTLTGNKNIKTLAQVLGLELEILNTLDCFERGKFRSGTKNLIEYVCSAFGEIAVSNYLSNNIINTGAGLFKGFIKNTIMTGLAHNAGKTVGKYLGEVVCELFNIQDSYGSMSQSKAAQGARLAKSAIKSSTLSVINCLFTIRNNGIAATNTAKNIWTTNFQNIMSSISSIGGMFTTSYNKTFLGKKLSFNFNPLGFLDSIAAGFVGKLELNTIEEMGIDFDITDTMRNGNPFVDGLDKLLDDYTSKVSRNITGKYVLLGEHNEYGSEYLEIGAQNTDSSVFNLYIQTILKQLQKINQAFETSSQAIRYNPDPLVLDLDSDGISLLAKNLGVYFDEDSKGLKEKTQWIGAEDALLAIDLNNNGIIDGGEELFGTSTVLSDGSLARTGFEALAQYDSNEDGVIDEQDDVFDRLLVWRDSNVDGVTDEGELETLRQHSIESIKLSDGDGDVGERRTTLVQYSDGHTANLSEVDFEADYYDVREKEEIEISDIIKELPNVQAIGNIPSLHTLMQLDESGELQEMVEAFMTAETVDEREEICTTIIEKICGADKVADGSRGTEFDAKKLAVIEAFMGREFIGTAGSNPVNTAATILSGVYDKLYNLYYGMLAKESVLKPYLSLIYLFEGEDGERYVDTTYFDVISKLAIESDIDMKNIVPEMARFINMMNPDSTENVTDFVNQYVDYAGYIEEFSKCRLGITLGTSEADEISGTSEADTIISGNGDDILRGNNGADVLYGNSGDDTLHGENGNDTLNGGAGSDHMDGGYGSDTYVFNLGDGVDTVFDYEYDMTPQDKILFGEGISASDVRMERRGNNLVVWYSEKDSFTVQDAYRDYYGTGRYFVESVEFSDGTIWNTEEIANRANKILGTEEDDALVGFGEAVGYHQEETFHAGAGNDQVNAATGNDIIYGEDGNDTLYGENGNDILNGGVGEDHLDGGYGSDTYVFNLGDGVDTVFDYEYDTTPQDKILFGEGITATDVRMERRGNNLVAWYSENDSFTVQDAYRDYYGTGRYFVESVEFSDGTVWNTEEIANRANKILGTDGDDALVGFGEAVGYHQDETFHAGTGSDQVNAGNGNDILFGEAGNDTLYGENGNDTLIGGIGSDYVDGGYGSDTYVFNLGDGVDTVFDYEYDTTPQDKILFGEGIYASDVRMERRGNNLVVWYSENDSFTVQDAYRDYYGTGRYFVESVEFSDGTVWNTEEIANRANKILGTDEDDALVGFGEAVGYHQDETFRTGSGNDKVNAGNGNDIIFGEAGNDTLYGENGNDILNGGVGEDHLDGGYGADTYVFNLGDGVDTVFDYEYDMTPQDRILFGSGISASDVRMERRGNNLVVWYSENDSFTVQDAYRDYYGTGRYFVESVEFSDGTVWNTEEIANRANKILGKDGDDTLCGWGEAVGYHQDETFRTGSGNDKVNAGNGNDIIYGEEGNDALFGENGNDTLNGGTGSDHMDGGYGSDTYVFNLGDGVDTVFDYEYDMTPQDRILFGEGISSSDVRMERRGNNLVVWYSENDSFTVQDAYRDYYGTGRYFVESVEFADGTTWDTEEIANRANKILGTDGDDALVGFGEAVGYHQDETFHAGSGSDQVNAGNGNDILFGEAGNDTLYGENGNDILNGGTGSDHMDGGYGSDTYVFNLGDGVDTVFDYEYDTTPQDKILFGEGISATDVRMERRGNNLVVWYSENDSFTVQDAYRDYYGTGRYFVESVEFEDGTVWNTEEIASRANKILGTDKDDSLVGFGEAVGYHQDETFHAGAGNDRVNAGNGNDALFGESGNDTLYGENGNDTLNGGMGNDYLDGGSGADTYIFNLGDGKDTIFDYEYDMTPQDKIVFGKGISMNDISLERDGLNLTVKYSENDQVTIDSAYRDYYGIGKYQIEQVEFEDGTKTIIDYDKESLVVTYQPEPVEEPVQTETEETPVSEETVDVPVQEEIVTEEISLSENDIVAETEEVFDLDEVIAAVEEVLNTGIVETDQEFELSEESDAPIVDYIDAEMEQATNLLVQEMSAPVEGNVSEHLTEVQPVLATDELLWTE